jgi:leucine dehydrogenase
MGYFELIQEFDHEQVVFCSDRETGLRAIIGIHDTTLGPALGGCRMKHYASEEEALGDVLRLSRAMTFKSSMAGLNLGGGKTVVMLDHPEQKTPELLKALAERIDNLKGTYIGAGDIGSDTRDLRMMKQVTPWVTGLAQEDGGLGDSSILTSLGVFMGIRAAAKDRLGRDNMEGLRVALQGVGKVGYNLLQHMVEADCQVWVTDVSEAALKRVKLDFPSINVLPHDELLNLEVDVFSPNAVGGIVTPELAQTLKVSIVAGGANNILSDETAGLILKERDILYAPDFVVNSGGVIMVACEIEQRSFEEAHALTEQVYERTLDVFKVAREEDVTTHEAARRLALRRIDAARKKPQRRSDIVVLEQREPALC